MANSKQIQIHSGQHTGVEPLSENGATTSQLLAILTLLPLSGTLVGLAAITFIGTVIGLIVATPLFVILSPVIVPAAITVALAVAGFLVAGAFGVSGLTSVSWVMFLLRQAVESMPEQLEIARKKAQSLADYAGQKTKEAGQTIQSKAEDTGRESTMKPTFRQAIESTPENPDIARKKVPTRALYAGQNTEESGETIQSKAQDRGSYAGHKTKEAGEAIQSKAKDSGKEGKTKATSA